MRIGFIGAGHVGYTLARYLNDKNHNVCGIYSKNLDDSIDCAKFSISEYYRSLKDLIDRCDTLFLTVNDDSIIDVVNELKSLNVKDKILIHTSGSLSSDIFSDLRNNNYCYSLHPIYAFNDKYKSYLDFNNAYLTLEGDEAKVKDISLLFDDKVIVIDGKNKSRYHAGCVMLSNLVCALAYTSEGLFKDIGINDLKIFMPLMINNINNISNAGSLGALTGPIKRNDISTIKKHLSSLTKEEKDIYIPLSIKLCEMSKIITKNDYSIMEELLKGDRND